MRPLLTALLLLAGSAAADVALADLFQDLAVLQRGTKIPVWGRADPREEVTVTFEGESVSTTADRNGRWRVEIGPFDPVAARPLTVTGKIQKNRIRDAVTRWMDSGAARTVEAFVQ